MKLNSEHISSLKQKKYLVFFLLLALQVSAARSQTKNTITSNDQVLREEILITSDRDMYIAGEDILLKTYLFSSVPDDPAKRSKVVYLDLHDSFGNPVVQIKVAMEGTSSPAWFILPDTLRTGYYKVRAYTAWMKNFPPSLYATKRISVINPFEDIRRFKIPVAVGSPVNDINRGETHLSRPALPGGTDELILKINIDPLQSITRSRMLISINASDNSGDPAQCDLSVAVVKSFTIEKGNAVDPFGDLTGKAGSTEFKSLFYPESAGHMISGTIISRTTGEPLRNESVSLSFVGKHALCRFTRTDEEGRFSFISKEKGVREIVIHPVNARQEEYYVELINPFDMHQVDYNMPSLYIDTSRLDDINNAIIAMQVRKIYLAPERQKSEMKNGNAERDFYGDPEKRILLSGFIELKSLREVIKEIVPGVTTNRNNNTSNLRMINKYPTRPFEKSPLVILDGVPVQNIDEVLNIRPSEMELIDVVNTRYFISGEVVEGIINLRSKIGDLSVINFDRSIFRQEYTGMQLPGKYNFPVYTSDSLRNSRSADFRNTLFWNPEVNTDVNGKAVTDFWTSDEDGEYLIIVTGVSREGKIGRSILPFSVKNGQ